MILEVKDNKVYVTKPEKAGYISMATELADMNLEDIKNLGVGCEEVSISEYYEANRKDRYYMDSMADRNEAAAKRCFKLNISIEDFKEIMNNISWDLEDNAEIIVLD